MNLLAGEAKQRIIRANHAVCFPQNYIFFDSETKKTVLENSERHDFKMAWGCHVEVRPKRDKNTEKWKFFRRSFELCDWIETQTREKRALWLFSHNLFFDLQVAGFFDYFSARDWKLDFIYERGLSYILIIRKDKRTIKGVSTTNYFDTSLKEIGKLVGYDKLKVDFDTASDEDLATYCRRDVEILKLAIERYFAFLKEHDLGKFGLTKASQAFNAFRHRFMKTKIFVHSVPDVIELEKDCYMGGRVECFHIGKISREKTVSLDVNSMYPFVMSRYLYPSRFLAYHENYNMKYLPAHLEKFCAVAEVLVDTPEPHFAVRQNGKIIFPVGRFRCYLCTRGLSLALARKYLKGVIAISFYRAEDLFTEYMDFFYDLKSRYDREGNKIYRKLVKYFMNCLYGKFGQFKPISESQEDGSGLAGYREDWFDESTGEHGIEYKIMNTVVREHGKEISPNSLVAVCAHVTEDARLHLDEIISGIGRERVLYCDTDSVKIRKADMDRVKATIDPVKLGALKLEEEHKRLEIIGPKSYITDKHRILKGIPKRAVKTGKLRYSFTYFPRQVTHLRNKNTSYFEARPMEKVLKPKYDKGLVTSSGRVGPFQLLEF